MCRRFTRSRAVCAWLGAAAIAAVAIAGALGIGGCGSDALSLTGGSIPIGTASVRGVVVRADSPNTSVPGATITLILDSTHSATITSDSTGRFGFDNIGAGHYRCMLRGPFALGVAQPVQWPVDVADGAAVTIIAAAMPNGFAPYRVSRVVVSPQSAAVRVGQSITFTATAYDANGNVLPVVPTLQLLSGIGTLLPDYGRFTASAPGTMELEAWVGTTEDKAEITITP